VQAKIAKIAVENTAYCFDKAFDYIIPDRLLDFAEPGCRVTVRFGRGNQKRVGIITEICNESSNAKLKQIEAVLDEAPLLNAEMLSLVFWLKDRTFCTLFEAAKVLLPTGINHKMVVSYAAAPNIDDSILTKLGADERQIFEYIKSRSGFINRERLLKSLGFNDTSEIPEKLAKNGLIIRNLDAVRRIGDITIKMVRLIEPDENLPEPAQKLTPKQQSVADVLADIGSASVKEICYFTGLTSSVISSLEKKGIVEFFENAVFRNPYAGIDYLPEPKPIELTQEQRQAFENLFAQYLEGKGSASLLYGITGSGKTQVYLRMIDEVIAQKKGVIVMVPEIALTPQTLTLFHERYGNRVAVFHSALSVGERVDEWKRVKNGEALIAIGTRSAIFAPFESIGLIIIDEEQEHTYKSEISPRYNAKDVARFRCAKHKALLILSSATPSVESYASAVSGKYSLNVLRNRYGTALLPEVLTVDMCAEMKEGNTTAVSKTLSESLKENLTAKKQSILLINRRGYNTFAACRACGKVVTCPSCSISMTYHHANERMMCHYCGFSQPFVDTCSNCGKKDVRYSGFGTQKIEDEIARLIPEARVLRMDTDTTMTRFAHEKKFEQFANMEFDILLGTQMVAKGLDFENVTLVGVVSVDQQLYNDDYRSMESAFSLITQVVGRSGRGRFTGKAIIQTLTPENEIIRLAAKQDYEAFFNMEIQIRKMLTYPPFCDICLFGFSGEDEAKVKTASAFVFDSIKNKTGADYKNEKLIVLGPMPARILKISNRFRYRLIIKCINTSKFRQLAAELLIEFGNNKDFSDVAAFVDMNPESIL